MYSKSFHCLEEKDKDKVLYIILCSSFIYLLVCLFIDPYYVSRQVLS